MARYNPDNLKCTIDGKEIGVLAHDVVIEAVGVTATKESMLNCEMSVTIELPPASQKIIRGIVRRRVIREYGIFKYLLYVMSKKNGVCGG